MTPLFFVTNIGLGAGLAMDACAVSMTNGLNEPKMPLRKLLIIAAMFGLFQALMPITGYFAGHAFIDFIGAYIPWIALVILTFLGGKMIIDGIKEMRAPDEPEAETKAAAEAGSNVDAVPDADEPEAEARIDTPDVPDGSVETGAGEAVAAPTKPGRRLTARMLFVQAIATSIDALSVGLSIANYTVIEALVAALIIALVTFGICVPSVFIGRKFGDKLGSKAVIAGGVILVAIGLEICLTGVL